MNSSYTAVIKQEDDCWIEEIPSVNCQEKLRKELMETLKVTLEKALEFNRQDAITVAGSI